ncbi:MAG: repressor LexA [Candidatus Goldbacteria bacterium]|nr:repressor LexA [Candidatus Goldiibacteriota bacterium]
MKKTELTEKEIQLLKAIQNWILTHGYSPTIRDLMSALNYASPNSVDYILNKLIIKGLVKRENRNLKILKHMHGTENRINTVNVPLVGTIACGAPLLATENILDKYPIDVQLAKPPNKYFLLRASGNSMDEANPAIHDGDLLLIRQQTTAMNGDIVVALINDDATAKEFLRSGDKVILLPHSSDKTLKPIIVSENLLIQGIVVSVIPKFEKEGD